MTIQEAKQKANKDDETVRTLLEYIGYLENNYAELKKTSEAHRQQVGGLYKQLDER